jgi:hypothetical protein
MATRERERERERTEVYFRNYTRRKEWMRKALRKFCNVNYKNVEVYCVMKLNEHDLKTKKN